jgi:hypothetical protein
MKNMLGIFQCCLGSWFQKVEGPSKVPFENEEPDNIEGSFWNDEPDNTGMDYMHNTGK